MDDSRTYIKMCEKANEIQILKPLMWDNSPDFTCRNNDATYRCGFCGRVSYLCEGDGSHYEVWLPRQDQLQEMVFGISKDIQGQVWELYEFATVNRATFPIASSMEQLWLVFVMRRKYDKSWNGEAWISEVTD
jgi:hypothetical protein